METVTVLFCKIFSCVNERLFRIVYPYTQAGAKVSSYVELYKRVRNLWVIFSGEHVQNRRNAQTFFIG